MDKKTVTQKLTRFQKILESKGIKVSKLILYGSYANGNAREDSDIDVVVISDDFTGKGYWERIDILSDAIYQIFEPIEAIAMTPQEWDSGQSMIVDFAKQGKVMFSA